MEVVTGLKFQALWSGLAPEDAKGHWQEASASKNSRIFYVYVKVEMEAASKKLHQIFRARRIPVSADHILPSSGQQETVQKRQQFVADCLMQARALFKDGKATAALENAGKAALQTLSATTPFHSPFEESSEAPKARAEMTTSDISVAPPEMLATSATTPLLDL